MKRLTLFMVEHYSKHGADGWILKIDIRKYFPSINHEVLLNRLRQKIEDPLIMRLIELIVYSWNADTGTGLAMGNQTSQLFALYYLDPLDRLVKEKFKVKHYIRYMDDMILLHHDKKFLQECLRQMREFSKNELKLEFNEKTQIFPLRNGADFLGWHFYLTDTGKIVKKLRTQNKKRLKRRLKCLQKGYETGRLDLEDIRKSMAATHGHLKHGHTYKLKTKVYDKFSLIKKIERKIEDD